MNQLQTCHPEELGIPSKAIHTMLLNLERNKIPVHSVLIARHGKLAEEVYYKPFTRNTLHRMYSVTKSFTSLAIGLLEHDGKISLSDPICKYFPEYLPGIPHPWLTSMTIEQMLEMRSCHLKTTYNKTSTTENWVKSFFQTPPARRPGTIFMYDTSASHTLCALVEKITGQNILSFLKDRVLREIGFSEESYILSDPFGTSIGGSGLMARSEDLLRVGLLLMNHGKDLEHYHTEGGRQLYPEDYIRRATTFHSSPVVNRSDREGYGLQFWLLPYDGYACCGMGDQLLLCYPHHDVAVVITADTQGMNGATNIIYRAVHEDLLPNLQPGPISQEEEARQALDEYKKTLTIPILSSSITPSYQISGKRYPLLINPSNFREMGVSFFGQDKGQLEYILDGKEYILPFGLGHLEESIFPGYEQKCAASGAWVDPETFYLLCWLIDESIASVHFKLHFGNNQLTVQMMKTEETKLNEYQGFLNS